MGSSRALVCSTAFILVLLSSASEDQHMFEQREITFDLDEFMQEIIPDHFIQKEKDFSDLLDPKEFPIEQVMMTPPNLHDIQRERGSSRPGSLAPSGRRPGFGPRSFGGPPMLEYPVQFPLSRPTSDNLQAICVFGDRRPRYPDSYFPSSGFGKLKRMASAVNMAESWFGTCCKGNQTWERGVTLCCATKAWELSVKMFCEEDSSVKDRLYDCCRLRGSDQLSCFNNNAPNPNYEATEELPVPELSSADSFDFDPSTCQRPVMTPYSVRGSRQKKMKKPLASQKADINFPPGRPTVDVIEQLCQNQKLRPLYNVKCLPGSGYELVARQAKTINRIEKGFKQCCKQNQNTFNCADRKWREELDKFCRSEQVNSNCCTAGEANDRYNCFQSISPDPYFNKTSASEVLSLHRICDTHKIIKKK
ncbi:extracellular matrix protein 1-like isoform X2 [Notolabrus celidotus]|nr:extracellular matrix protein 1-like isoform X2 [Notolabrus celidotus]